MRSGILLLALMLSASIASAQNATRGPCEGASLNQFLYRGVNWCEVDRWPESVSRIYDQVRSLNQKAMTLLKLESMGELPFQFSLELIDSDLGALDSSVQSSEMKIGVMPEAEVQAINSGVYLHELGHLLATSDHPMIPAAIRKLSRSPLLTEALADLLSLAVEGTILTTEQDLPECLDRTRYMTSNQSFLYPLGYFLDDFAVRRIVQCCQSLLKRPGIKVGWMNTCEQQTTIWKEAFPPLDRRRLSFDTVRRNLKTSNGLRLDPHQLGLPINSFLSDFARESGLSLIELDRQVLTTEDGYSSHLKCSVQGDTLLQLVLPRVTLGGTLKSYRETLNGKNRDRFDRLWLKHGMEVLSVLESPDQTPAYYREAFSILKAQAVARQSPCSEKLAGFPGLSNQNQSLLNCTIYCVRSK